MLAGSKERDLACLMTLGTKYDPIGIIGNKETSETNNFIEEAKKMECEIFQPLDVNDKN